MPTVEIRFVTLRTISADRRRRPGKKGGEERSDGNGEQGGSKQRPWGRCGQRASGHPTCSADNPTLKETLGPRHLRRRRAQLRNLSKSKRWHLKDNEKRIRQWYTESFGRNEEQVVRIGFIGREGGRFDLKDALAEVADCRVIDEEPLWLMVA
jgi:hypothetical protein